MTGEQERRAAQRFSIQAPTEYANTKNGSGFTENVSLSGVRIEHTSNAISVDTELGMRFSFYYGSFETAFEGKVVRRTDNGFAVRFGPLDTEQMRVLRQALALSDGLP